MIKAFNKQNKPSEYFSDPEDAVEVFLNQDADGVAVPQLQPLAEDKEFRSVEVSTDLIQTDFGTQAGPELKD